MTERPILFSAPMVLALLAGTKTQTRRTLKLQPAGDWRYPQRMWGRSPPPHPVDFGTPGNFRWVGEDYPDSDSDDFFCPYGIPGDRLWVKETFVYRHKHDRYYYRADSKFDPYAHNGWSPSIFMPRKASRITLKITDVRVERLQAIDDDDALAEGIIVDRDLDDRSEMYRFAVAGEPFYRPRDAYFALWDSINGKGAAAKNPWVWAITFKRVRS